MGRLSKVFNSAKDSKETTKERKEEIVNLNFKVSAEVRRKIKQYAAKHDKSIKEVLIEAFEFYIKENP